MQNLAVSKKLSEEGKAVLEHPLTRAVLDFGATNSNPFIYEIYQQLIFQASKEEQAVQLAEIHAKDPGFAKLYAERDQVGQLDLDTLIQLH